MGEKTVDWELIAALLENAKKSGLTDILVPVYYRQVINKPTNKLYVGKIIAQKHKPSVVTLNKYGSVDREYEIKRIRKRSVMLKEKLPKGAVAMVLFEYYATGYVVEHKAEEYPVNGKPTYYTIEI